MIAVAVPGVVLAAPAAARPMVDPPLAPSCSEANVSGGAAAAIPVPGDPAAYQKCGPAGPIGIKHCAAGTNFDATTGYCLAKDNSAASLVVAAVWQEGDGSVCQSDCPPKPIKVRLTYSGSSVGTASVALSDPAAPGVSWGGSASALTGDGDTHSVVVTTNKLVPTAATGSSSPVHPLRCRPI